MSALRACLYEDHAVLDLEPLTLTRPAFDLLCGQTSLAAKQFRVFPAAARGLLVRPHLAEVVRQRARLAVNDLAWLRAGPTVLVNGRWLPASAERADVSGPCLGLSDDEVAYAVVERDALADVPLDGLEEQLRRWRRTLPCRPAGGRLVRHLWELVEGNGEQITRDWQSAVEPCVPSGCPAVVGPRDRLAIDPTAQLDPLVVADTTNGPVVIGRDAAVRAFTRLEGPCCIGPRTQVLGARVRAGTTLGPGCRVGGEVEASIIQGHSNKYHDGFLGHAYVGEWVNLGAGTQNSDLRNDYGEVRVMVDGRLVRTGRSKVGCFLGDHTKTGLGALLNTGTSAGVFCNLLPCGGYLPRHIPSFTACRDGALAENADLPGLLATAAQVMRRRGHELTEAHAELYRTLLEQTAAGRRQALREAEARRLRRSA
jgi:UDP-N-acetylglucosamine diphosphorylase/glucosamine-1-phosphate N-acetyltransferase